MIIDIHTHLRIDWHPFRDEVTCYEELLRRELESGLVDGIAVSSLPGPYPSQEELRRGNHAVYRFATEAPERVIGFAYANPRHGPAGVDEFRRCVEEWGMRGLKLWFACLCDDPLVFPYIEQAIEYDLPTLVHVYIKTTGMFPFESTPGNLVNLARRYPEAALIMAHYGGPWQRGMKAVRDCDNIIVDLSGSISEMDSTETLVRHLGAERVVFGSDNTNISYCLGKVLGADLSESQQGLILGENAARLLGLGRRA